MVSNVLRCDAQRRLAPTTITVTVCAMVAYPLRQPSRMVADAARVTRLDEDLFRSGAPCGWQNNCSTNSSSTAAGILVGLGELWFTEVPRRGVSRGRLSSPGQQQSGCCAGTAEDEMLLAWYRVGGQRCASPPDSSSSLGFRMWRGIDRRIAGRRRLARRQCLMSLPGCGVRARLDLHRQRPTNTRRCSNCGVPSSADTRRWARSARSLRRSGAGSRGAWCFR